MADRNDTHSHDAQRKSPPASRRNFLQALAGAGAAISFSSRIANAQQGEIGYWAKDLTDDQLTDMFSTILRIRWYERTLVDKMLTDSNYRGYNHFYVGQEAVATGVCAALKNTGGVMEADLIYSTHRPTGHAIAKGVDIKKMAAEYDFRATGLNKGYAGEMHISDKSIGFMGADGMIGPGPVIATGSAFAIRARGSKQVVVNFGGDGTYATPHFHSALNNAALLKLPFIYVHREQSLSPVRALFVVVSDEGHRGSRENVRHSRRRRRRAGRVAGLQRRQDRG